MWDFLTKKCGIFGIEGGDKIVGFSASRGGFSPFNFWPHCNFYSQTAAILASLFLSAIFFWIMAKVDSFSAEITEKLYQAWSSGLNEKISGSSGPTTSNLDPNSKPFAPRQVFSNGENIPAKQGMFWKYYRWNIDIQIVSKMDASFKKN